MPSNSLLLSSKSTQIKQTPRDKFFSRFLTRELTMSGFSVDDYHGETSVAVPFDWESQPGTPRIKHNETPLPPLTPPPSYFYTSPKCSAKKHSKPNLVGIIFPKRGAGRKGSVPSSPAASSSSSSSSSSQSLVSPWPTSYSVPSSPMVKPSNFRGRYGLPSPRFSFDSKTDEEEDQNDEYIAHVSTLNGANSRSRGCFASIIKLLVKGV
ncbi:uncharacterized protein LOC110823680 [Carica papaya]|uniref:uncharacterized protein LOC110823680 n=1 Tax=Carica papaya TaxID=3649 RepID=UPI000B8D0517|nr:uncharacterized protein LOC110823680 [Carica papaya]